MYRLVGFFTGPQPGVNSMNSRCSLGPGAGDSTALDANEDAKLAIVAASGLPSDLASKYVDQCISMRTRHALYSADPGVLVSGVYE